MASKYIKKYRASDVFFVELVIYFPFLFFFIPRGISVSGILYRLVPYEWYRLSFLQKIKDVIELLIIGKSRFVKAPMCLNDSSCACYYNKMFSTTKFVPLADPIIPMKYEPKDIRETIGASRDDKVILHFGGMNKRKGTLLILDAAFQMKDTSDKLFVFAGRVSPEIKDVFYEKVEQLKEQARIIVYDEFCSFEFLSDLCYSSDCIVVPYLNTSYSSGIIGYASLFQKTVIGPSDGLLGKLIIRNNLGVVINSSKSKSLASLLESEQAYLSRPNDYYRKSSVERFASCIMDKLMADYN